MNALEPAMSAIDRIEGSLNRFNTKAAAEKRSNGKINQETKNIINKLGEQQREAAEQLLSLEQKSGVTNGHTIDAAKPVGIKFIESAAYREFSAGDTEKVRFEIQNNTVTGSDVTVAPDRKPGVVGGAFQPLSLESFITKSPTSSNAIEYMKETSYSDQAAETSEGGQKPESSLGFTLVNQPVSTVAHWVRISRQLASDAPLLAAYISSRMMYGVNRRVESGLATGDGAGPNINGIFNPGNHVVHQYSAAQLGGILPKLVLIRKLIADTWLVGYPADAILLNPLDWAQVEIELMTTSAGQARVDTEIEGQPALFGVPVIQSIGITADTVAVGAFKGAATIHNRQDVVVELSGVDANNFTTNLVTVRAERRLALTVEKPAAIIAGDLTPA